MATEGNQPAPGGAPTGESPGGVTPDGGASPQGNQEGGLNGAPNGNGGAEWADVTAKLGSENANLRRRLQRMEEQFAALQGGNGKGNGQEALTPDAGSEAVARWERKSAVSEALEDYDLTKEQRRFVREYVEAKGGSVDDMPDLVKGAVNQIKSLWGAQSPPPAQQKTVPPTPGVATPSDATNVLPSDPSMLSDEQIQGMSSGQIYEMFKKHRSQNSRYTNPVAEARGRGKG